LSGSIAIVPYPLVARQKSLKPMTPLVLLGRLKRRQHLNTPSVPLKSTPQRRKLDHHPIDRRLDALGEA
jgi:hypothetical protein